MPDRYEKQKRTAISLSVALMTSVVAYFTVRYALPACAVVFAAFCVSSLLRPAADLFSKRTHIPRRVCGAILSILAILFFGFVSAVVAARLLSELGGFLGGLVAGLEKEDNALRRAIDFFVNLKERLPIFDKLGEAVGEEAADRIYSGATELLKNAARAASEKTASLAGGVVTGFPGAVFAAAVTAAGIYYFTTDPDGVKRSFSSLLPQGARAAMRRMRERMRGGLSGYIRAYLLIMLVTFCELFAGFLILGFRYSFLIAAAVAIVDILPVLGSGTVLVPWSAILFLSGDAKRGTGLLVMLGIMYVVRQIIEPRLLGKYMGHHPFVSLFSAYLGFILLGVPGMIAAPIGVFVMKSAMGGEEEKREGRRERRK